MAVGAMSCKGQGWTQGVQGGAASSPLKAVAYQIGSSRGLGKWSDFGHFESRGDRIC